MLHHHSMRTTIHIHDDVLQRAKELAQKKRKSLRYIINEALRSGLEVKEREQHSQKYQTQGRDLGLRPGINLDNVQELLSRLDEEDND